MKIIAGNWKMNPQTLEEVRKLFFKIKKGIKKYSNILQNVRIIICPPFVYLPLLLNWSRKLKISFGAQNVFWEEKGAFTGEISPKMLKDLKVEYVILGHSERRRYFGETDENVNKKLKSVFKFKLKPILCIGETKRERKEGKTFRVLKREISLAVRGIKILERSKIIVAYEPIWAIGTGNPCDPETAKKVLIFLRKILKKNKILYGGSVNSENARDYINVGFDGLLIGGASLRPKEFIQIIRDCSI